MQGIYCIENVKTGKRYIGSSIDVNKRLCSHFAKLRQGTHHCKRLQSDFTRYGETAFTSSVLKETFSESELILAEQYCISTTSHLYNTLRTVGRKNSVAVKKEVISQYTSLWKKQLYPQFHQWYLVPLMFEYHSLLLVSVPFLYKRVKAWWKVQKLVMSEKQILRV